MAAPVHLKIDVTEDEKYHNLMRWLIYTCKFIKVCKTANKTGCKTCEFHKPEDHWSCIAHLSVEDMVK